MSKFLEVSKEDEIAFEKFCSAFVIRTPNNLSGFAGHWMSLLLYTYTTKH